MDAKDKLESLRFLAELHRNQFIDRRKYEGKILFTVLAFYILSAAASLKEEITLPDSFHIDLWFIWLAIITGAFLAFVHLAQDANKKIAERAEVAILSILNGNDGNIDIFPPRGRWGFYRDLRNWIKRGAWTWVWQTIIVIFFAMASSLIITAN